MKVLAIDTATERCSVALRVDDRLYERSIDTARGHADIVLSMVGIMAPSVRVRRDDSARAEACGI